MMSRTFAGPENAEGRLPRKAPFVFALNLIIVVLRLVVLTMFPKNGHPVRMTENTE